MFRQLKDENLAEVTGTAACHCGIWKRAKARKATWCILSRRFIAVGDLAWRPVKETQARKQRIADSAMQMYIAGDKGMRGT